MRSWWLGRSFKVRLTLWYAAVMCVLLGSFALAVFEIVEHRLAAELDRQLRIDFDLVEAQLDTDPAGNVLWLVRGAHGDEGFARLSAWFEVWSEEGWLLFRHWPVSEAQIKNDLPAPLTTTLRFYGIELEDDLHVRLMERPARLQGRDVIVRVLRDESSNRQTLRQIVEVFVLALPFAVVFASVGGYLLARRSLRPVTAMAAQAKKITSESLEARLPNPNPNDEFGQLASIFNETLQRLESSFTELKRFTADASHELRTPITALRAVGEVALRREGSAIELRDTVGSMLEEAQRLNDLVESLLELARMQSRGTLVSVQTVKVVDLFAGIRDSLAVLAAEKQQLLAFEAADGICVAADPVLLRQALLNIVHNAIRYSPSPSRITVRAIRSDAEIVIEVRDEGPGIPAEHRQKIFDRFYRIDKSRSRAAGGHGLGLAIAKSSIERQGGSIEVESEVNKGSAFRIRLPIRSSEYGAVLPQ